MTSCSDDRGSTERPTKVRAKRAARSKRHLKARRMWDHQGMINAKDGLTLGYDRVVDQFRVFSSVPVAVLDVSCPLGLVNRGGDAVRKVFTKWGRDECSPDTLAVAVLMELGIITWDEYVANLRDSAAGKRKDHL